MSARVLAEGWSSPAYCLNSALDVWNRIFTRSSGAIAVLACARDQYLVGGRAVGPTTHPAMPPTTPLVITKVASAAARSGSRAHDKHTIVQTPLVGFCAVPALQPQPLDGLRPGPPRWGRSVPCGVTGHGRSRRECRLRKGGTVDERRRRTRRMMQSWILEWLRDPGHAALGIEVYFTRRRPLQAERGVRGRGSARAGRAGTATEARWGKLVARILGARNAKAETERCQPYQARGNRRGIIFFT